MLEYFKTRNNMTLRQLGHGLLDSIHTFFWLVWSALIWPIRKLKASFISLVDYMFNTTISSMNKLLLAWSILVVLVVVSLMLYAVFYSVYVPTAEISRPVYLAFSVCTSGVGICSFPSANVTFWNNEGTIQEFLGPGQAYTIELELVMPDSHANRDLGMFMVVIKMFDREGHISATSQRSVSMSESTMFRYRSVFMRVVDMVLMSPLYFVGLMEQKTTLTVELFSHFVDDYYHPSVGATVEIHSHKIEFYSASLTLLAKFTGLKYFLHNWPLVSAVCAFWFNLFILAVGIAAVLFQRNLQQNMDDRQAEDAVSNAGDPHETSVLSILDSQNTRHHSTQTKPPDNDDDDNDDNHDDDDHDDEDNLETYNVPLVQEPVDFPIPAESEEIFLELRQRRVN